MQTPDEWLADFEKKVADLQQKAIEFKRDLESSGAVERSEDGAVEVSVAPSGALLDLRLGDAAMRKSAEELAAEIMALVRRARRGAATGVAAAFAPLGGDPDLVQRIEEPRPTREPEPPRRDEDFGDRPKVFEDTDKW